MVSHGWMFEGEEVGITNDGANNRMAYDVVIGLNNTLDH